MREDFAQAEALDNVQLLKTIVFASSIHFRLFQRLLFTVDSIDLLHAVYELHGNSPRRRMLASGRKN